MPGLYKAYEKGQTHVQIGNNENLCDYTFVTNAAHAHILAAEKLGSSTAPTEPGMEVAGETFFITNDEPWPFFDFANAVWDGFDKIYPGRRQKRKPFVIPKAFAMIFATLAEWIAWVRGEEPTFNRFRVTFACTPRWHSIEKAKRALGYKPDVSLKEGINKTIEVCVQLRYVTSH